MFKIQTDPSYWEKVTVEIPGGRGKTDKRQFEIEFRRYSQSELDALQERINKGELTDDTLVREIALNWRGVQDADGAELPFNPDNLSALLDVFPARSTIISTFFKTIRDARLKN